MNFYTSELLNLSVETMNSISEESIDLLQDKQNFSSPYRSIFVVSSSKRLKERVVEEEIGCSFYF